MDKRKLHFSIVPILEKLNIEAEKLDFSKLIYLSLLLILCFVTFLSATLSWIQLSSAGMRIFVQYAFSGLCLVLLVLSRKEIYLIFGFNLLTIAVLAYLYFPSGGSLGSVPLFILANALFSWIQLYGENKSKLLVSMLLHECLFLLIPAIDIYYPELVAKRYFDRDSQIRNLMLWGSVNMVLIVMFMLMWSRLLQSKLNALIGKIEVDDLTGAYRRPFMLDLIENTRINSGIFHQRHSLVFIDLDNFKSINDGYSHLVGDEVLVELVHYLRGALRKSDYICRFGGDEFFLFLPNTRSDESFLIMERIRLDISTRLWTSKSIRITISAGVGELVMANKVDYSLELIDKKMYESKRFGKDRVTVL